MKHENGEGKWQQSPESWRRRKRIMSLLRSIASRVRWLFRKERVEELNKELRGFLDMAAEEKMKEGMSRKDALRAVRLERGSFEITKEVVRSAGWESFVETCWQDLRFGWRMLRKWPGLHHHCGAFPRPGHRGQHGHIHPHRCDFVQDVAGEESAETCTASMVGPSRAWPTRPLV